MRHHGAILATVLCGLVLSGVAFAGSLSGTITYDGSVPTMKMLDMAADPTCEKLNYEDGPPARSEMLVLGAGNTMANVFVQVKNAPAGGSAPSSPAVIDQNGCVYHPHVIGVMVGQDLLFRNSDGILHNVHGLPQVNREFNIGMPPTLREKLVEFGQPEPLFRVKCDVHPWMNAYVAVMEHPFFAVTGEDGRFTIPNLPDGTYEIEAWHERLGTQTQSVTVSGSGTADFSFRVPGR
jgi:plastocyanin